MKITAALPKYRATQACMKTFRGRPIFMKDMSFREVLPLTLKNSVSGKSERATGTFCTHELTMLLACLKRADFDDRPCTSENVAFQHCVETEKSRREAFRQSAKDGLLGAGDERRMTNAQVNKLMQMHPQPDVHTRKHNRHRLSAQEYHDRLYREKRGHDKILP